MPLPNRADGQLIELAPTPRNNDQFLIRLDWNKGRHSVDGRYNFNQAKTTELAGQVPTYITINDQTRGQNVTIGDTFTINPQVVNQLRVSFNRMANFTDASNIQSHADLGGALPQFGPPLPPNIVISGRVTLSNASPTVPGRANETFQISDTVTMSVGAHTVKAGGDLFKTRLVAYSAVNTMGVFTFNGQLTGNPAAEFLIGRPATMLIGSPVRETGGKQTSYYAFMQDDWKISRRLTLNLGLRYELPLPWYHPNNFWSTLQPGVQSHVIPNAPVGLVFPGDPGVPRGLITTDKNNFAPRFGFAWDPAGNGRSSIRGAYGIFYEAITGEIIANDGQPFSYSFTIRTPFSLTDPLRGQPAIPTTVNLRDPVFVGLQQVSYPDPNYRTGYIQQINLNVQRQIASTLAIQAAYVSRLGHKQMMTLAANPAIFRPGATLGNISQRRILPEFGNNRTSTSQSNSNYHAFQFELTKRMSQGFSLQGAYTFSRAIDLSSAIVGGIGIAPPNTFDLSAERGLSDFHAKHIASFSWLWEIPKAPVANGFVKVLLHDWQANGLVALRTGRPFTVISGRDDALSGTPNQRPNVVGEHRRPDDRPRGDRVLNWFDRTAFAFPQTGTYGNAGRNALIGPGSANTNMALFKTVPIHGKEGFRLQFRSEFFNIFNSTTFGVPVRELTAGERMGRLTFAEDARVIQFALKVMF
jgi:outer membrane receptor protein involved in Fe transport